LIRGIPDLRHLLNMGTDGHVYKRSEDEKCEDEEYCWERTTIAMCRMNPRDNIYMLRGTIRLLEEQLDEKEEKEEDTNEKSDETEEEYDKRIILNELRQWVHFRPGRGEDVDNHRAAQVTAEIVELMEKYDLEGVFEWLGKYSGDGRWDHDQCVLIKRWLDQLMNRDDKDEVVYQRAHEMVSKVAEDEDYYLQLSS